MRRKIFVNRETELEFLESLWEKRGFSLVIIYGRRRVGKTRLLREFARDKKAIYYVAAEAPYEILSSEFSNLVKKFFNIPIRGDIIEVLETIADLQEEKTLVILDEFQYVVEADQSFPSRLQRLIDQKLGEKNMMLVLCGSAVSFFEKKLLGYKSPLFGRREASMKIRPLTFPQIKDFFPNYSIEELLTIYGIAGGVPAYLEKIDPMKSVEENIRIIITPGHYLYDEAVNILRQEVREPRTYFTILAMVAEGRNSPSELASAARIDVRSISKYIELLEELDILRRERPLGFKRPVKVLFKDNYFRFWFTYIYKLRSLLEIGYIDEAFSYIKENLDQYISRIFEDTVVEIIPSLYRAGLIKTRPIQVGKWWYKNMEIDAIVRDPGKTTTYIEIKWRELTMEEAKEIVSKLEEKAVRTGLTSPKNYYVLITKQITDAEKLEIDEHRRIIDLEMIGREVLGVTLDKNKNAQEIAVKTTKAVK